ncbi:ATP-binding protein [Pseudobacteroides cellulosolvens]|uniref:histidine kinase n=1 Tax=Pseudobacteroides cellulosolvens ATCC 35603 = DSM 2933 TaxID=398512 RepID=A0A0L6JMN1_9FIRM|nr:ATP-binding protein [Pseudobacteroides cellulosolvens]KNY27018.1 ATP-binding region ATPase domain protein [Pseudobacteroides cellulosolvens ATCC 35603 = DSM 2933]
MRDLSLHLMDVIQNSIVALGTRIDVTIAAYSKSNELKISVADNGKGMDEEMVKKVTDPFITTRDTRKVGLGISLFKASAEMSEGHLGITSKKGVGTTIEAVFKINNIDRPPLGDVAGTFTGVLVSNENLHLTLTLSYDDEKYVFDTEEVKKVLNGVSINEYEVLNWIKGYINEGINVTFGGVLNEINS